MEQNQNFIMARNVISKNDLKHGASYEGISEEFGVLIAQWNAKDETFLTIVHRWDGKLDLYFTHIDDVNAYFLSFSPVGEADVIRG